ncbi:MAG: hypothetical protein SFY80_07780 [Verrucomicrobiota bacterium]|nr:hypothetical protein [Verrucomicrobiota bacterium]
MGQAIALANNTRSMDDGVTVLNMVVENTKLAARENPRTRQEELGQFLTPTSVAGFMASLFGALPRTVRLLDAESGIGRCDEFYWGEIQA